MLGRQGSVTIKTCHWFECSGGIKHILMAVKVLHSTTLLLGLSSLKLIAGESIMDYLRNREDLSQVSRQSSLHHNPLTKPELKHSWNTLVVRGVTEIIAM